MENKNTILVVGQAKPSREDAIYNLHGEFYISLIVERDTGKLQYQVLSEHLCL